MQFGILHIAYLAKATIPSITAADQMWVLWLQSQTVPKVPYPVSLKRNNTSLSITENYEKAYMLLIC